MEGRIDRRRFLRTAAATLAGAAGLTSVLDRLALARIRRPERRLRQTIPPDGVHVFLPVVSGSSSVSVPSKLGVHTIRPDGVLDLIYPVAEAGAHVALVKAVDDLGYLQLVKEASPETICVARRQDPKGSGVDPQGDPTQVATARMNWHMQVWEPDREYVDYWEVLNEPDPPGVDGHRWLAEFNIACLEIAQRNGFKLAAFSYSVGVPEWEEWEAIVETGVFEVAKAGGHALALHEYNWPNIDNQWGSPLPARYADPNRGPLIGRYRYLYEDFLIPKNQVVPLVVTEAGYDPSVFSQGWDATWKQRFVADMARYDEKLSEDDYVIGCALFTLGGVGIWKDWEYDDVLDELAAYIIASYSG
jgi:hypothetical protein